MTSREGQQAEDYAIRKLSETEMCVVEQGERHAVILKPGSRVLVVENRDMSNSRTEPVLPEIRRAAAAATR